MPRMLKIDDLAARRDWLTPRAVAELRSIVFHYRRQSRVIRQYYAAHSPERKRRARALAEAARRYGELLAEDRRSPPQSRLTELATIMGRADVGPPVGNFATKIDSLEREAASFDLIAAAISPRNKEDGAPRKTARVGFLDSIVKWWLRHDFFGPLIHSKGALADLLEDIDECLETEEKIGTRAALLKELRSLTLRK